MSTAQDETALARWTEKSPALNDFASTEWTNARPVYLTRYWSGAEAPQERHASARVLWSDDALHVLFDCRQEEPLVVAQNPETKRKTIGLWDRDVCEIFVAPDPEAPEIYYELEAAPTGEWLDVAINFKKAPRESDWGFSSGITLAVRREGQQLLIRMRIPWSRHIPRPESGQSWRVNFLRCIGAGENRGYLAWKPTLTPEPNFHVPSAFGWLWFV
jgi:hypothetical protein